MLRILKIVGLCLFIVGCSTVPECTNSTTEPSLELPPDLVGSSKKE